MSASEPSFGPTVPINSLVPVFAPGSSDVTDWIAPLDADAAKQLKLQPLHGPGGKLVGYVHQSFQAPKQYGEELWPTPKPAKQHFTDGLNDEELAYLINHARPVQPWVVHEGKCSQNYDALQTPDWPPEAVKTHRRRREDYMYADPTENSPTLKPVAVETTVAVLRHMTTHTLEKLISYEQNCAKTFKKHSLELRTLLERLNTLEQTLEDHRTVIKQLQKRLNMHSIHAVSSSPVIPKAKRRKIKPHGHRQENNDRVG